MGRLVISEFMTLDGIMEAPGMEEHSAGRNGWALRHTDAATEQANQEQTASADALLFGRRTYEIWASFWPDRPPDDALAVRLAGLPKYVVSSTLRDPSWANTTVIRGDVPSEVARLTAATDGNLVCYGSGELVATLLEHDLVDEFRLMLFPVILGSGKRLFKSDIALHHLRLVRSQAFPAGAILLTYERETATPTSEFEAAYSWTEEQMRSLRAAEGAGRVLRTVLFTDIVGSTEQATALGDRAWTELLERHHAIVRQELARFRGREIDTAGDAFFALFEAPAQAVSCASAIVDAVGRIGMQVRAGVHTGEVELTGDHVRGITVHVGARVVAHAAPNQVVVSSTVRDLVAGSRIEFDDLGTFALKGVPGEWRLSAVRA
jgi:class 3 adenylate cyclase